jgi:hypothetical protein
MIGAKSAGIWPAAAMSSSALSPSSSAIFVTRPIVGSVSTFPCAIGER